MNQSPIPTSVQKPGSAAPHKPPHVILQLDFCVTIVESVDAEGFIGICLESGFEPPCSQQQPIEFEKVNCFELRGISP